MPKVYRDCPQCGDLMQMPLTGNRRYAERQADWMLSKGTVCNECGQKNREEQNAKAAESNAAAGLPTLQGSPKQVAWAETIRSEILSRLERAEQLLALPAGEAEAAIQAERFSMNPWTWDFIQDFCSTQNPASAAPAAKKLFSALREQDRASWWIDCRSASGSYLIQQFKDEILSVDTPRSIEKEAIAEATVQPETLATRTVATITIKKNGFETVTAKFPEKNDKFKAIVKGLGYRWNSDSYTWGMAISATHGSAKDRAAELMHSLLAGGFIVTCLDDQVREKALKAGFEPRWPRWVSKAVSHKWQGYIVIEWTDNSDLDDDISSIPSAKKNYYKQAQWYVRATEHAAILDFADTHDFRITPNAKSLLAEAKELEEKRLLAKDLPEARKVMAKRKARDKTINGKIDDELRDED